MRGGGENPFIEVTVNSKEENSEDFYFNYVQEFSLSTAQFTKKYMGYAKD
jgi:hypothetical protein